MSHKRFFPLSIRPIDNGIAYYADTPGDVYRELYVSVSSILTYDPNTKVVILSEGDHADTFKVLNDAEFVDFLQSA